MSDSITAGAGFFLGDVVSPDTATDLDNAVAAAQANISSALAAEAAAAASATAAASFATLASGSQSAAATSATTASSNAANASSSATSAIAQATNAATSATAAGTSATAAATSATAASTSATAAASSATAASNSATTASTQATNAAASATAAAASVSVVPTPGSGNELNYIRVTGAGNAYEARTPAQTLGDIGGSSADVGRNKIDNAQFNIAQRGAGAFTTNGAYTMDRWYLALSTDTVSCSQQAFNDTQRASIGDEEATNAAAVAVTGSATSSAFSLLAQNIENVRRLANKTVTVSFWAYATAGTPNLGVGLRQFFGTGGSPSSLVDINASKVTLSTTPTRFSLTTSLASIAGKTLGTNNDHYTRLAFFFSSGSTNNALAGTIGVQTATFVLWGVQLEVGSVSTALEKLDAGRDLERCQRFYQVGSMFLQSYNATLGSCGYFASFSTPMRAAPTLAQANLAYSNGSAATATGATTQGFDWSFVVTSTGGAAASGTFTASADL